MSGQGTAWAERASERQSAGVPDRPERVGVSSMRVALVLLTLVAGLLALPASAAAAGSCALTTAVSPGHQITITGSNFDASADVAITQTWSGSSATAGGTTGPQTTTSQVTSDATGGFVFTVDAGPGHGGTYDFEAMAGACTATTRVVAVETAGGINTGGGAGGTTTTPPPTDTAPLAERGAGLPTPLLPIVAILVGIALLGLALSLRRPHEAPRA